MSNWKQTLKMINRFGKDIVEKSVKNALRKTLRHMKTTASKEAREYLKTKKRYADSKMRQKASSSELSGSFEIESSGLPLVNFTSNYYRKEGAQGRTKAGNVKVQILKKGPKKIVKKGFMLKPKYPVKEGGEELSSSIFAYKNKTSKTVPINTGKNKKKVKRNRKKIKRKNVLKHLYGTKISDVFYKEKQVKELENKTIEYFKKSYEHNLSYYWDKANK